MNYTESPQNVVHAGTGHRMHEDNQPLPTVLTDADVNQLIWSLMEVVVAGGQTPASFDPDVPASYKKFKNALDTIYVSNSQFTGANQSLTPTGFQKLPGGEIRQWGFSATTAGVGSVAITFPIAFPNECLTVQATVVRASPGTNSIGANSTVNRFGVTFHDQGPGGTYFYWEARGK